MTLIILHLMTLTDYDDDDITVWVQCQTVMSTNCKSGSMPLDHHLSRNIYQILNTGYRALDIGYWIQGTGYMTLDTGHMTLDTGHMALDTVHRTMDPIRIHEVMFRRIHRYFCISDAHQVPVSSIELITLQSDFKLTFFLKNRLTNTETVRII